MSPVYVRRALHVTHALLAIGLIATGYVIEFPDLRAQVVGGYGPQIAFIHRWSGVAWMVAPALALCLAARPLLRDLDRRLGPPDPLTWAKFNIVTSLVISLLLSVSGIILWLDIDLSLLLYDVFLQVHIYLTWALSALIPIHLIMGRRKIVARTREILRIDRPEDFGFPLDEDL